MQMTPISASSFVLGSEGHSELGILRNLLEQVNDLLCLATVVNTDATVALVIGMFAKDDVSSQVTGERNRTPER